MQNSNDMKTGELKSVSENLSVGAENKKQVNVDACGLMSRGGSRARIDQMDLSDSELNPIKPSAYGTDD